MKVIEDVMEMQQFSENLRREGKKIALVPTMGYLHEGHLSLFRRARDKADVLVVSIFVNPAQFGPTEDFEKYPRDFERDSQLCEQENVDIIFNPAAEQMYSENHLTKIHVEKLTATMCGLSRPGHFQGVVTVVAKLFNIVKPHVAWFGEKDYQQFRIIYQMVCDLNMDA
ncbi:MAG: pantoate--beta-alanine ligase, partial [Calditrichia bacterium]